MSHTNVTTHAHVACDASFVSPFQYSASAAEIIRNPGNDDVCCDRDRKSPLSPSASLFALRGFSSANEGTTNERSDDDADLLSSTSSTNTTDDPRGWAHIVHKHSADRRLSIIVSAAVFCLQKNARHLSPLCVVRSARLLCLHVYYLLRVHYMQAGGDRETTKQFELRRQITAIRQEEFAHQLLFFRPLHFTDAPRAASECQVRSELLLRDEFGRGSNASEVANRRPVSHFGVAHRLSVRCPSRSSFSA